MKTFIYACLIASIPMLSLSQKEENVNSIPEPNVIELNDSDFNDYCANAGSYYTDLSKTKSPKFSGEIKKLDFSEEKMYHQYDIQLLEEQTQYFRIEGSTRILVVKSVYRLKLEFKNLK